MDIILLNAFRKEYTTLQSRVEDTISRSFGDVTLLQNLGDNLETYYRNVTQVRQASSTD